MIISRPILRLWHVSRKNGSCNCCSRSCQVVKQEGSWRKVISWKFWAGLRPQLELYLGGFGPRPRLAVTLYFAGSTSGFRRQFCRKCNWAKSGHCSSRNALQPICPAICHSLKGKASGKIRWLSTNFILSCFHYFSPNLHWWIKWIDRPWEIRYKWEKAVLQIWCFIVSYGALFKRR